MNPEPRVCEGKSEEPDQVGMVGVDWIFIMTRRGGRSLRERRRHEGFLNGRDIVHRVSEDHLAVLCRTDYETAGRETPGEAVMTASGMRCPDLSHSHASGSHMHI